MEQTLRLLPALIVVAFIATLTAGCAPEVAKPSAPQSLPDAMLARLSDDSRFSLSALHGKVALVNFWATWCTPCRNEMASLQRASEHFGARLAVIGISLDHDANLAKEFLHQRPLSFPNFSQRASSRLQDALRIQALPETMIIDADGVVVARVRGARDWSSRESIALIESWISAVSLPASRR